MIHIAHEEGYAVMAHVNGAEAVRAAAEAGVDSVEHGNFVEEDSLHAMAEHHTVWVPTFVTITNMIGDGRFPDETLYSLRRRQGAMIRRGFELGVTIAAGSDAGAYCVPHGRGVEDEYRELKRIAQGADGMTALMDTEELNRRLQKAEAEVQSRFCRIG
jgi:imidazolonepropionase-like amidohydrolase